VITVLLIQLNLGDKFVIKIKIVPTARKPKIRESEIPRFRVFAGSLTLRVGSCAQAARWFKSHFIPYSYMAILEIISEIPRFLFIWDLGV
jgi:hypothetical protein